MKDEKNIEINKNHIIIKYNDDLNEEIYRI